MATISTLPRSMPPLSVPTGVDGRVAHDEAVIVDGPDAGPPDRPCASASVEEQRERAQREFKRIWNLCVLPQ